jgi:hypothetical protein
MILTGNSSDGYKCDDGRKRRGRQSRVRADKPSEELIDSEP